MWPQYDPENSGYVDKIEAQNFVNDVLVQKGKSKLQNFIFFNQVFVQVDTEGDGSISKLGMINLV